jgi:iron complex outermembrane receptor protein
MVRKSNSRTSCSVCWLPIPIAIWLLLSSTIAGAVEPPHGARYAIEQPAQDMGEALQAIARLTSTSVLFDPRAVAGRVAKPVSGRLSGAEAIAAALEGSGLEAHITQDGAVVVRQPTTPASLPPAPASSSPLSVRTSAGLAQEQVNALAAQNGAPLTVHEAPNELTRVEVTGSRLKRIEAEGPTPVNVYTRQDIEKSGQSNLGRFLAGLNEVSTSSGEGTFGSTLGQATVQLRGLPLGSTLVLINGRRVQAVGSSAGNFFNLNLIPMAAVERVEVVPLGSSAVYGGDALAGVVNVILKKSIDGQSLVARLGAGRGFGDGSVSLATGGRDPSGSFLVMGSYSRSSPLSVDDRATLADADYRRFGGTDQRRAYCSPGTVSSASGGNLPGLSASVAGTPIVAPGQALRVSDFEPTAGQQNLCNVFSTGAGAALLYGYETWALHATGEHQLWGSWSAFSEVTLARERMKARDFGLLLTGVLVPATNPFNPFGVGVRVNAALDASNGTQGFARQTNLTRVLAGLRGDVAGDWEAELTVSTIQDTGGSQTWAYNRNSTTLAAALASSNPATALNPFTTGRAASDDVLHGIWTDRNRESRGRKDQVAGLLRGTVAELPAGRLEGIVGAEASRDRFVVVADSGASQNNETRHASAAFGELRAPLLRADGEGGAGWTMSTLSLAGRKDRYSDFGSASTYQAGLEIRPARSFLIRASAADSFKPPTTSQTNVTESTFDAAPYGLVDPARGREPIVSGTVVRTTNKSLGPERGTARGLGIVWEPEGSLGTRLSATHWQLRIRDTIAVLSLQSYLDNEALFPGVVIRGPSVNGQPGPVTSLRYGEVNVGRLETSGTDVDVTYAWRAQLGKVALGAGATRTSEYQVQLAPGAAVQDRLGRRFDDFFSPQWKGRLSLLLDQGAWTMGMTSRYLGSYKDAGTSTRRLGNFWTHDIAASLNLKKVWPDWVSSFKAATAGLSIANATNREPQFIPASPYFDLTQADWRGRYISVRVSLDW